MTVADSAGLVRSASGRLVLRPVTRELKLAMQQSPAAFAGLLGAELPEGWPEFPQAFRSDGPAHPAPWTGYLFLSTDRTMLIGNGGVVAPPDDHGTVEIGYEIAPAFRNRGFASDAAATLVAVAQGAGAQSVIAHSLAETNASNAVMQRIGMRFDGEEARGPVTVWRWRLDLA